MEHGQRKPLVAGPITAIAGEKPAKAWITLDLRRGQTERVLCDLIAETSAAAVYFTRGYEPFQRTLEERLKWALGPSVQLRRFGGHILFEPEKIANQSGKPFRVYSPFYRALTQGEAPSRPLAAPLALPSPPSWPQSETLENWGLEPAKPDWAGGIRAAWTPGEIAAYARLRLFIERTASKYRDQRNNPGSNSHLPAFPLPRLRRNKPSPGLACGADRR